MSERHAEKFAKMQRTSHALKKVQKYSVEHHQRTAKAEVVNDSICSLANIPLALTALSFFLFFNVVLFVCHRFQ